MGNIIETVLLGALGSLLAAEIVFRHRIWCMRIIHAAANRIPDPHEREVRREEWLASLNDQIGLYASLKHAIGCFVSAPAVAAASKIPVRVKAKSSSVRYKITLDATSFRSLIGKFKQFSSWRDLIELLVLLATLGSFAGFSVFARVLKWVGLIQ